MRVLIISPENDNITRYMRVWAEQLVKNHNNTHHFFHLDKEKANHKRVTGILSKKDMDIVCLNGHGDDCRVAGHDNEILIDPDNVSLLAGIKVHALACNSAKNLGNLAISHGAKCYIGYDERFYLMSQGEKISDPLKDDVAKLFLDPAYTAPKALLDGKDSKEAIKLTQEAYVRSIKQALNSDIQSDHERCVPYLLWNLNHLKSC